jgi:hypothetical protein
MADGAKDRRGPNDAEKAEQSDDDEPGEHHWREEIADKLRSFVLD